MAPVRGALGAADSTKTVSEPHKEIVGEGKNAKYVKDCTELHLGKRGIDLIAGFETLVNLEILWLNDNRLTRIAGLDANLRIRRLYVHNNAVSSLKGSLQHFKFLQVLDLANNHLHDLERVLGLLGQFNFLEDLTLKGNPCCEEEDYRLRVITALPSLHILDCHVIKDSERRKARRTFRTGGVEKLSLAFGEAYERPELEGPPVDVFAKVKAAADRLAAQKAKLSSHAEQIMYKDAYGTAHAMKRATLPHPETIFGAWGRPPAEPFDITKHAAAEAKGAQHGDGTDIGGAPTDTPPALGTSGAVKWATDKPGRGAAERPKDFFRTASSALYI